MKPPKAPVRKPARNIARRVFRQKSEILSQRMKKKAVINFQRMLEATAEAKRDRKTAQDESQRRSLNIRGINLEIKAAESQLFGYELQQGKIPTLIFKRVSPNGIKELIRMGKGPKLVELLSKYYMQGSVSEAELRELKNLLKKAKDFGKRKDRNLIGNRIAQRNMKLTIQKWQQAVQQQMGQG